MSCEHAETTTLLWLYGEGPEDHAMHVATCAECTEVSALHADVVSAAAPLVPVAAPKPANRNFWLFSGAVGLVAAALFVSLATPTDPAPADTAVALVAPAAEDWDAPLSDITDELDALDAELADLTADLANL